MPFSHSLIHSASSGAADALRRDAEAFLLDIGARLTGLLGHLGGEDGTGLGMRVPGHGAGSGDAAVGLAGR